MFYIYILCNNRRGTLYVGSTTDLKRRMFEHKEKFVEGFSKRYGLDKLVYYEVAETLEAARSREYRLKKWNREWKIILIEESNPEWVDLSNFL